MITVRFRVFGFMEVTCAQKRQPDLSICACSRLNKTLQQKCLRWENTFDLVLAGDKITSSIAYREHDNSCVWLFVVVCGCVWCVCVCVCVVVFWLYLFCVVACGFVFGCV